ncbi:MAG TPA: enoyl-CoA hydratase/isomerase family protein [Nannocystis sp.]|jgi:enoyl-CoA hydratase/carnithine racemase
MYLRFEDLGSPVWRVYLTPDEHGEVAIGGPGVADLEELLQRAEQDPGCRVIVIASEGGAEFCRGMDLRGLSSGSVASRAEGVARYARCLGLMRGLRAAVVCLVDGAVSGGGVGLVAACDLAIVGPAASFVLTELYFGLVPAVILPVLGERMGPARARWLALSGVTLNGDTAVHLGLADERSDDFTRTLAVRLKHLLRLNPEAVGRLKRLSAEITGQPLELALAAGVARTTIDIDGPEVAAAVESYLAGELPPWAIRQRPEGQR